ncbi:MAG TPA: LysR family transcriptional regulator [Ferrovibrio sp.]|jgi:molybdate transport system regulatory protein|uniref:winged helix-turn-helix domain-containing protein n=1 Tax=Ferrovibrio sp. TaxID=1917215 RepID=UPI002ED315CF
MTIRRKARKTIAAAAAGPGMGQAGMGQAGMRLRLRLMRGSEIAVGPGKADLLQGIAETGSISAAGRRLNMSYKRAWLLIDTMNRCFRAPLVTAGSGGKAGGGAALTALGEEVLARFRHMEQAAQKACAADLKALRARLRKE